MNAQELTRLYAELSERSATLRREMDDVHRLLSQLGDSLAERQREANLQEHKLAEQLKRSEKWDGREQSDNLERKESEREFAKLRQQNALLIQKVEDQQKRLEKWDTRLWGLLALAFGAILSLSAGLIVALSKR